MIFKTTVAVLCAVPEDPERSTPDQTWYDAVAYFFGVNAANAGEAASIATHAAENAVDRNGRYIGGVVIEVHVKCLPPEEYSKDPEYLLQPVDQPGIFYVTGTTTTGEAKELAVGAAAELRQKQEKIKREGLPEPSFVHPTWQPPPAEPIRIYCPGCGRWTEVDGSGILYSFFDGLDPWSFQDEYRSAEATRRFIESHLECVMEYHDAGPIVFLYRDDERYHVLNPAMRE